MINKKTKKVALTVITMMTALTIGNNSFTNSINTVNAAKYDDVSHDPNNIWKKSTDGRYQVQQLDSNNTVYYAITSNKSNAYYKIWQKAAQNWNNLGVINIQQVSNNDPRKEITLTGNYHYMNSKKLHKYLKSHNISTSTDGMEADGYYNGQIPGLSNYAFMGHASATLTPDSWDESYQAIMVVAQHEFGHALGFDHYAGKTNGRVHIMNASADGSALPLGNLEKQLLLQHYGPFIDNTQVDTENFQ